MPCLLLYGSLIAVALTNIFAMKFHKNFQAKTTTT